LKRRVVAVMAVTLLFASVLITSPVLFLVAEELSSSIHDVAVVDVTPSKTVVWQNYSISINVTGENQGDFTQNISAVAYYNGENLTRERWESFRRLGDVNRDGYIDDDDYDLIVYQMNLPRGDPDFNPDCDICGDTSSSPPDGDVDWFDFGHFAAGYGLDIWSWFNVAGGRIGIKWLDPLSPGTSATLVFSWNTMGVAFGNYTLHAVACRVWCENETTDNAYFDGWVVVSILCDVDGDGNVDWFDFGEFAQAYGSSVGGLNYNDLCDFDLDGDIDWFDFGFFALNFGKTAV
jgi:hypothetical protein